MTWTYVWLGVTAVALMLEFLTSDLLSIWFAGGGIVAMILALCGLSWYVHLPVFIVLSFVLLLSFRKVVMKYLNKGDAHTNADAAIGKEYKLLTPISLNEAGSIKVNDVVWSAVTENEGESVSEGTLVKVKYIKGNKYIVEVVK